MISFYGSDAQRKNLRALRLPSRKLYDFGSRDVEDNCGEMPLRLQYGFTTMRYSLSDGDLPFISGSVWPADGVVL